jgi:Peptidase family M48
VAVNLGLITFAQTREEIALVIAHELSHNILNHAENSMKERAVWLTSEEYKNSLNAVLDSKYERLTKLKKVMQTYSFSRSKHNRYHEGDADSLAIELLKNANISFDPKVFLRLDSTDNEYKMPLKNATKNYFTVYNIKMDDGWFLKRSRGLSSKNYNSKDTSTLSDSLKTHPDCVDRFKKNEQKINVKAGFKPVPASIKDNANKMLLWNMFDNLDLTSCYYRILLEKDKGNTDPWYDFMLHNVFSGLHYSNKQLNRFNAIGIKPKEYICTNYYELQNMFEQIPTENLEQLYKSAGSQNFWEKLPTETKGLKSLMASINFDSEDSDKKKSAVAKDFITNNPTSMYCEFADHFKK